MLDETQSTAVGGDSPAAVSESTDTLAPAVEQSGEQAQERSGDVTAQPASEGTAVAEGEATPPPPAEDDPLKDIPTADELEQQVSQKVPYAQALLNLRKALEARNEQYGEASGKLEPVAPLLEKYGDAATIQSRLEVYDQLFTPVINPTTNEPERDAQGFPVTTAAPFIERIDAENPGMAEQILMDTLKYQVDFGDGRKLALYQQPEVQRLLLEAWGLDPERVNDYRNIDALSAPQATGEVTTEELETIPEGFRDTYKALPPGIREDLKLQDAQTRQFNLEVYKERADRKAAEAQAQQQQAQERQQAEASARQYVEREQETFVTQQLQESYAAIMDGVKSQVTLPEGAQAVVGALLFSLRDPDYRQANAKELEAMGVKLDSDFDQALARADQHYRDAKRYELFRQGELSQRSLAQAKAAKNEVLAKLAPVALRAAKLVMAQQAQAAGEQGRLLDDATRTRPVPGAGGGTDEGGGVLPPGMLPTDPRAGIYIARQTGLLGG